MKLPYCEGALKRRTLLSHLLYCGAFASTSSASMAQSSWSPSKLVRIVVPWPPGGGSDLIARLLSERLQTKLGQAVVVENRPGATGIIGSEQVYRATPDGHTLLLATMDSQAISPHLNKVPFETLKYVPVAGLAKTGLVLMIRPGLSVSNLTEFKTLVQRKSLSYATPGPGSSMHLLNSFLGTLVKADNPLHVPFQGLGPAVQAVLGDQVDMVIVPTSVAVQWTNRLKALAVTSASRLSAFSDVPTLMEGGINLSADSWFALVAPPGTPEVIANALAAATSEVMMGADLKSRLQEMGLQPFTGGRTEFVRFYESEYQRWGEIAKGAKL
jgi:tripartite-type tricarboxylate transporter receptor subunit TctC